MEPIALTNASQAGQTSALAQSAATGNTTNALSSDFETFLLMLTTQMENQDPLNPVESEDFAVQLATFSGVEQQVRTNTLLENLAGGMGMTSLAQLAGWVGMEARVAAPAMFSGAPIELAPDPAPGSDAAQLIVLDATGREVAREAVPLAASTIDWVGIDAAGQPLPPGIYSFQLASISQGEVTGTAPVAHYARITEARQGLEGIELVTEGGITVPSDSVTALREALPEAA